VLIRVRAVSVNPLDWHFMEGSPYFARMMMGLRKPGDIRLGTDFSGVIEAVGKSVTQFKPGDEVFGGRTGAFAQYVTAPARNVVLKPANLTFEEAAAVPVAAITALQGLRDGGKIQAGQKVLINGASGGVGTFAVQIAKSFGANVTGVCSTRNVDMVRSLGADQVIDYTKDDFTKRAEHYDLILDNVINHPLRKVRRVLNPQGAYIMIGGGSGKWLGPLPRLLNAMVMNKFVSQDVRFFLADLNQKDLLVLRELLESGKVKPVIDRQYPFKELPEAMRYLEEGHARAKVVVTID
jgi:NADPH:quinone reductase-like Zn-dependent oxidoreductase